MHNKWHQEFKPNISVCLFVCIHVPHVGQIRLLLDNKMKYVNMSVQVFFPIQPCVLTNYTIKSVFI